MERICDNSTPCVPCSPTDLCQQDCGNPLTNYSAEAADGIDFIGVSWQIDCANHTLVFQRGDSQAEANDNAQALAYGNMFINTCPGAGIIPGGGVPLADSGGGDPNLDPNDPTSPAFDTVGLSSCDPPGGCDGDAGVRHHGHRPSPRRHVFYNAPQTCTICCANGDCHGFTTFGGKFPGLSQLAADRAAHSYACRQARLSLVCLGTPHPTIPQGNNSFIRIIGNNFKCCSGSSPSFTIPANGKGPFGWSIVSGSLPSGMTAVASGDSRGLVISGTPSSPGDSTFTVRVQNSLGAFAQQTYVISSIGFTTDTLPDSTAGSPYNESITADGGTAPHTFTLVGGTLPPGLSLADDGTISGTPTCLTSAAYTFTVSVTDSNGPGCNKTFSMNCGPGCVDWSQLVWPAPTVFTDGAGTVNFLVNGSDFIAQCASNGAGNGNRADVSYQWALVTYNGPACNATVTVDYTRTGVGNQSGGEVWISIAPLNTLLDIASPLPGPTMLDGLHDYTIPIPAGNNVLRVFFSLHAQDTGSAQISGHLH